MEKKRFGRVEKVYIIATELRDFSFFAPYKILGNFFHHSLLEGKHFFIHRVRKIRVKNLPRESAAEDCRVKGIFIPYKRFALTEILLRKTFYKNSFT